MFNKFWKKPTITNSPDDPIQHLDISQRCLDFPSGVFESPSILVEFMSHCKRSQLVTITNPQGLHMRPAYVFAEAALKFESKIELIKNDLRIDGKSVLSILTLGASEGTEVMIEATGNDADTAIGLLQELLSSGFPMVSPPKSAAPHQTPISDESN